MPTFSPRRAIERQRPHGVGAMLILGALLAYLGPAAGASSARSIAWSGYVWDVRNQPASLPGPNSWSDSAANVRVEGSELVLSIAPDAQGRWNSVELRNQRHLGYGTYRWIVNSDLSTVDAHDVLGMYTWGGPPPSNNEIDIEAARWGDPAAPSGSATVWQDALSNPVRRQLSIFTYSATPPYVNEFTWKPGKVSYRVADGTGRVLLRWAVTSGVPVPSVESPVINYWRYQGVAPASARSVRIASFTFNP